MAETTLQSLLEKRQRAIEERDRQDPVKKLDREIETAKAQQAAEQRTKNQGELDKMVADIETKKNALEDLDTQVVETLLSAARLAEKRVAAAQALHTDIALARGFAESNRLTPPERYDSLVWSQLPGATTVVYLTSLVERLVDRLRYLTAPDADVIKIMQATYWPRRNR